MGLCMSRSRVLLMQQTRMSDSGSSQRRSFVVVPEKAVKLKDDAPQARLAQKFIQQSMFELYFTSKELTALTTLFKENLDNTSRGTMSFSRFMTLVDVNQEFGPSDRSGEWSDDDDLLAGRDGERTEKHAKHTMLWELFKHMDEDQSNDLDLKEFLIGFSYWRELMSSNSERGLFAFMMFDTDKNGRMDQEEFTAVVEYMLKSDSAVRDSLLAMASRRNSALVGDSGPKEKEGDSAAAARAEKATVRDSERLTEVSSHSRAAGANGIAVHGGESTDADTNADEEDAKADAGRREGVSDDAVQLSMDDEDEMNSPASPEEQINLIKQQSWKEMSPEVRKFVEAAFEAADKDNSGTIELHELLAWAQTDHTTMEALGTTQEALESAFLLFDRNGDNQLDRDEFAVLLHHTHDLERYGCESLDFQARAMTKAIFDKVDTDNNGTIDFEEFKEFINSTLPEYGISGWEALDNACNMGSIVIGADQESGSSPVVALGASGRSTTGLGRLATRVFAPITSTIDRLSSGSSRRGKTKETSLANTTKSASSRSTTSTQSAVVADAENKDARIVAHGDDGFVM